MVGTDRWAVRGESTVRFGDAPSGHALPRRQSTNPKNAENKDLWYWRVTNGFSVAMLPVMFSAPECLNCGACCFSTAEDYVPVKGADWSRLGAAAEKWAVFVNNRAFMRMESGHCAALGIEPAVVAGEPDRFVCAIYETRPQVCRDLARGSGECHGEWTMKRETAKTAAADMKRS